MMNYTKMILLSGFWNRFWNQKKFKRNSELNWQKKFADKKLAVTPNDERTAFLLGKNEIGRLICPVFCPLPNVKRFV